MGPKRTSNTKTRQGIEERNSTFDLPKWHRWLEARKKPETPEQHNLERQQFWGKAKRTEEIAPSPNSDNVSGALEKNREERCQRDWARSATGATGSKKSKMVGDEQKRTGVLGPSFKLRENGRCCQSDASLGGEKALQNLIHKFPIKP